MTTQIKNQKSKIRDGVAIMAAVVTLVILSLLMSAIAWQLLANRRMLHHREYQLQAAWLARAGIEHAAARLLAGPDGYAGDTLQLIPFSSVTIEVIPEPNSSRVYRIISEARYPTDAADYVTRSATRTFKRQVEENSVQLVTLSSD